MSSKFYLAVDNCDGKIVCKIKENGFSTYEVLDEFPFEMFQKRPAGKHLSLYNEELARIPMKTSLYDFNKQVYENRQANKDIHPEDIYYGMENGLIQYIQKTFKDKINFNPKYLNICSFDIETDVSDEFPSVEKHKYPINTICSVIRTENGVKTICYTTIPNVTGENIIYVKTELEMLLRFCKDLTEYDVDVITGWNTKFFDIPYIVKRMEYLKEGASVYLSPVEPFFNGLPKAKAKKLIRQQTDRERGEIYYDIAGLIHLDYMEIYIKFTREKQPSYKLDHIADVELKERKHDYSAYGGKLKTFFEQNKQAFVEYNIQDTMLVHKLNEKLKYMELAFIVSYFSYSRIEDIFAVTRVWDAFIYKFLSDNNVVIPPKQFKEKIPYKGAYVKPVIAGKHDWLVSFDLTSMYPMIIRQVGISPETIVRRASERKEEIKETAILMKELPEADYAKRHELSLAANGTMYRKDIAGVIPTLVQYVFNMRTEYKNNMKKWLKEKQRIILELERRDIPYDEN